jgi:CrcB protein
MGLLVTYFVTAAGTSQSLRLFLATGILGGYTTFSAFSLETVLLIGRHQYGLASIYVAASVLASVAGLALGAELVRLTA